MDNTEVTHGLRSVLCVSVSRYYCSLQLQPVHTRILVLISVYQSMQLATLMVPSTEDWNVPWNYTVFWPAWLFLNCVARIDQLLMIVFNDMSAVLVLFLDLFAARVVSFVSCLAYFSYVRKARFRSVLEGKQSVYLGQKLIAIDRFVYFVFSSVFSVPYISFVTAVLTCSHPFGCLSSAYSTWISELGCVLLPAAVVVMLCDRVATCDVQWKQNSNSISSPQQGLILTVIDFATCFFLSCFDFQQRKMYVIGIAGILGAGKFAYVYKEMPYHCALYNEFSAFQGSFLFCQSILICVSLVADQTGIMPSLSLFFLAPMCWFFSYSQLKKKDMQRETRNLSSEWEQELLLRWAVLTDNTDKINPRKIGLWNSHSKLLPLLWTAYFYLAKEDMFSVKKLISQISSKKIDFVSIISTEVCLLRLKVRLESDPEEKVLHDFLTLARLQKKVTQRDLDSTLKLRKFYEKLLHRHISFSELVSSAQSLSNSLQKTLTTYKRILQTFKQKRLLLEAYCSLLETLGKTVEVLHK